MRNLVKTALAVGVVAAAGQSYAGPVLDLGNGLTVSFEHQAAGDGSGKTSTLIDPSNVMGVGSGFFVETFDAATYNPGLPYLPGSGVAAADAGVGLGGEVGITDDSLFGTVNGQIIQPAGNSPVCSLNAWGGPAISTTGGGFAIRQGSVGGVAAAPAGNSTCYAYAPQQGGSTPATLTIDYLPVIDALFQPGETINYLGLYYGSIDRYNDLEFFDANGASLAKLFGADIVNALNGDFGNQVGDASNVYVNVRFDVSTAFTSFTTSSTGIAVEVDNIVVGVSSREVPIPATLALFGLGLAGLGFSRRKKA